MLYLLWHSNLAEKCHVVFEKFSVLSHVGVVYYVDVIGQVSLQILEFVLFYQSIYD